MSISVEEAVARILEKVHTITDVEEVALSEVSGRILAEDMTAEFHNPPFDRTPVDGYACRAEDTTGASKETPVILQVMREIDAGGYSDQEILPGQAVRIMTGAAIPPGCNCCIRQEDTNYAEDQVEIYKEHKEWDNYCFAGEDFRKGDLLLKKGTRLGFVEAAVLAGMGKAVVPVYRLPKIALLTSGDEVVEPGEDLGPGKIYNSNRALVSTRLRELGASPFDVEVIRDDPAAMAAALERAVKEADLIITTGGVSVGKKDIMHEATERAGAERIFWGVAMKPGMPTLFTVCRGVPIISLSGNPFGVAATMEFLVRPALSRMMQNPALDLVRVKGVMADTLGKSVKGRRMVRAYYENGRFHLPKGLHSNGVISSMAGCNCLIDAKAENGKGRLETGMEAEAVLL